MCRSWIRDSGRDMSQAYFQTQGDTSLANCKTHRSWTQLCTKLREHESSELLDPTLLDPAMCRA